MKIGLVARADNTGLGNMSWEYYKNLKIDKVLVITRSNRSFPERYGDNVQTCGETPTEAQIREFLVGVDVLLTIETPYNWDIYRIAREMGVKSVLIPMYEFLPDGHASYQYIDLFMCDSIIGYDRAPSPKIYIPFPINRKMLPFKKRTEAKVFLHNAGHGGLRGRNGTAELIKAIPLVKSDVHFIINSQFNIHLDYEIPNLKINIGNVKNYWDLWKEGDVFILPNKFGGNFLPVQEAMSVGMPVIMTDMYPANSFLPMDLLIEPKSMIKTAMGGTTIDMAFLTPEAIAEKIDYVAGLDISAHSERMNVMASEMSWDVLKDKILAEFKKL